MQRSQKYDRYCPEEYHPPGVTNAKHFTTLWCHDKDVVLYQVAAVNKSHRMRFARGWIANYPTKCQKGAAQDAPTQPKTWFQQ